MLKYFISDLHINNSSIQEEFFISFLDRITQVHANESANELYILGDLFEVWLGDDLEINRYHKVIDAIKIASKKIKIYFIAGNRDFLIGNYFLQTANIEQLNDPHIFTIKHTKICLTHGDMFCTLDKKYQLFRLLARNKISQTLFTILPKKLRQLIGNFIRHKSRNLKQTNRTNNVDLSKYDINPIDMKLFLQKNNIDIVIHGHTHIPLVEHYSDIASTRYVLGEWKKDSASIIILEGNSQPLHIEQKQI
jgi:UDP-2,3-diacylglucosamine hydrolase